MSTFLQSLLVVVGSIVGVMWIAAGGRNDQSATSPRRQRTAPVPVHDRRAKARVGRPGGAVEPAVASGASLGLSPVVPAGYPVGPWVRVRSGMILLLMLALLGILLALVLASLVVAAAFGLHTAAS